MNLSDYIEKLNTNKKFKLISDLDFWSSKNVNTPEELDKYLVICDIQELQKQIYGSCRPIEIFMVFSLEDLRDRFRYLRAKLKEI